MGLSNKLKKRSNLPVASPSIRTHKPSSSSSINTQKLVLTFILLLEIFAILFNWTTLWQFVEGPTRIIYGAVTPNNTERRRSLRVVYLDSENNNGYFEPKHNRQVLHIWDGARDLNHHFPDFKSILRNPGTLDSKNGEDVCVPSAKWQTESNPTCNSFHELGFAFDRTQSQAKGNDNIHMSTDDTILELLGVGTSIHAWKVTKEDPDDPVVLKTLQIECKSGCDFNDKFYHKQTLDAVASERLTFSPYVLDVYGFCGMSVLNEFGRFLKDVKNLSMVERLKYSRDLAAGMADMHSVGGADHAMLCHGDFKPSNVIFSKDGKNLKISDFNKGRFLGWNTKTKEPCGYLSARSAAGAYILAPEEWFGKVRTEKTDIYHLGGMIYYLLTAKKPYHLNESDLTDRDRRFEEKGDWALPALPEKLKNDNDPSVVAMRNAIGRTVLQYPNNRASAKEVLQILNSALEKVGGKS